MDQKKHRVLLVEDEDHLLDVIKMNLELEGCDVEDAGTGKTAIRKVQAQRFDLVILDVMLPEVDGFEICEHIRLNDSETPILFLTAKDSSEDKIKGLKLGADDYLTKPFNLEELLLRVKVLLKHNLRGKRSQNEILEFRFDGNIINFKTYEALLRNGKKLKLTNKELTFLKLLIERKDTVVSREQILSHVWGYDVFPSTRTVDNFINAFRKYFERNPSNPRHFFSIRGIGYKFTS